VVIATHNEQLTRSVGRALRLHEGKLVDERRQRSAPAPE